MKIFSRVLTVTALATALVLPRVAAQTDPAAPAPATPAPVVAPVVEKTNPPAKPKAAAKKVVAKPAAKAVEPKPEPVTGPAAGVAKQNNINLRGQATIKSESISQLKKGEPITILELVEIKKPKQDEPAHWYRIALPPEVPVWVHSSYVDTNTSTIKARRLNLRGGPGENFSIVGRLEKGAAVKPVDAKGAWLKIETPTNAFGFVAAHLVERTAAPAIAIVPPPPKTNDLAVVPPSVPPTVTEVTPAVPPVAPVTPVTPPAVPATDTNVAAVTPAVTNAVVEAPTNAPIEIVRKIVSREGILKGSFSIQAPTYFELRSLETGRAIAYVHSSSTNLVLKDYKDYRVIITGEEVLDERWQHTPVLVADSLQTVP